jgi:SAM-dependent methyltransferase
MKEKQRNSTNAAGPFGAGAPPGSALDCKSCRGCGSVLPEPFLDLGLSPLANSYVPAGKAPERDRAYPLAVAFCPACYLVQLTETVPPGELFSDYLYFSSYSESWLEHARRMADSLAARFRLGPESRVLEVASNDGYLLQYFQQQKIRVLGVEPARNIAEAARKRGIPTMSCFFGPESVAGITGAFGRADVLIGNNVLAHVPAVNDFLAAARDALAPGGCAVFEFPYLLDLLENCEFDTIYHEHVFYYSLSAIGALASRAGLHLVDVEPQSVHGGSLRVFLAADNRPASPAVARTLEDEDRAGLTGAFRYAGFSRRVHGVKDELVKMLDSLRSSSRTVAAYGAPAKGNTLLNFCGIGTESIAFTVDRSPHKQGKLLPGSRIPIYAPEELLRRMPEYTLILPWNLSEEIISQQSEYAMRGGQFVLPIPEPRIVRRLPSAAGA